MKSFFFGPGKSLYGTLHEPPGAMRDVAVLLCCPGPQEYHMTHWAFRRLASQLARAGLPTMRFDWSSTGDSAGASHEASVQKWQKDLAAAATELKDVTGLRKLAIVGLRLGAAVAVRALSAGLKASHLVLWEPVVNGARYLKQLEELDEREALRLLHRVSEPRTELGGYLVTSPQRAELQALDVTPDVPRNAQQVLLLCGPNQEAEVRALQQVWSIGTVEVVREQGSVTDTVDRDAAVTYTAMLQVMTERLSGARP